MMIDFVSPYLSPKLEITRSDIDGLGMRTREAIRRDEVAFRKGGYFLTREVLFTDGVINSYLPVSDNLFWLHRLQKKKNTLSYT